MFTLGFFYTIVYLIIFLALLVISFFKLPIQILTNLSASTFFIFLYRYTNTRSLFLFLIFILTGLPPVGFFFIKFNIFCFILYNSHIFIILLFFCFFLFNMLFYVQFFNFKNFKLTLYNTINPDIIGFWYNHNSPKISTTSYNSYTTLLFVINVVFFSLIMLLLFSDFYFLISLI